VITKRTFILFLLCYRTQISLSQSILSSDSQPHHFSYALSPTASSTSSSILSNLDYSFHLADTTFIWASHSMQLSIELFSNCPSCFRTSWFTPRRHFLWICRFHWALPPDVGSLFHFHSECLGKAVLSSATFSRGCGPLD
jgi:hypothetical protein